MTILILSCCSVFVLISSSFHGNGRSFYLYKDPISTLKLTAVMICSHNYHQADLYFYGMCPTKSNHTVMVFIHYETWKHKNMNNLCKIIFGKFHHYEKYVCILCLVASHYNCCLNRNVNINRFLINFRTTRLVFSGVPLVQYAWQGSSLSNWWIIFNQFIFIKYSRIRASYNENRE